MTRKQALAKFCVEEAEKLASKDGFVSVEALARRFRATIVLRPLLVEAMLASRQHRPESEELDRNLEWLILIDNEKFPISWNEILTESSSRPLPARFRNTVAHELAHSLVFREEEFGFNIQLTPKKSETRDAFLRRVETEAEALSPLLLIPQSRIVALSKRPLLEMSDLESFCSECGASRDVFINRLRWLTSFDPEKAHLNSGLTNVAIGLGEWNGHSEASLKAWPLFVNFDKGILPKFLSELQQNRELLMRDVANDRDFWPNGGSSHTAVFEVNDSPNDPDYMRMKIRLTVQQADRAPKSRFLFLVSKI